jgi:hypothetical protein
MRTLGHRFALPPNPNLAVADRDMQAFEERAELTLASVQHVADSRMILRGTLGALAQQQTGEDTVNGALVGQTFIAGLPGKDSVYGLYGGAGFDWRTGRFALFASGESPARATTPSPLPDGWHARRLVKLQVRNPVTPNWFRVPSSDWRDLPAMGQVWRASSRRINAAALNSACRKSRRAMACSSRPQFSML